MARRLAEAAAILRKVQQRLAACDLPVNPGVDEVATIRNESGWLGLTPDPRQWEQAARGDGQKGQASPAGTGTKLGAPGPPTPPEPPFAGGVLVDLLEHHDLEAGEVLPHLRTLARDAPELRNLAEGLADLLSRSP
jgi:hypothetical protein